MITPARLRQNPLEPSDEEDMKTVEGSLKSVRLDERCLLKPNLSVICMLWTRSRSSLVAEEEAALRRRLPNELTDLSSPDASSWSHCTGSQVGMQGVTSARNWTTSDEGNLNASKYERSTWNRIKIKLKPQSGLGVGSNRSDHPSCDLGICKEFTRLRNYPIKVGLLYFSVFPKGYSLY